jgi:hypothetical protein
MHSARIAARRSVPAIPGEPPAYSLRAGTLDRRLAADLVALGVALDQRS